MTSDSRRLLLQESVVAIFVRIATGQWPQEKPTLPPAGDVELWRQLSVYVCGCGLAATLAQPDLLRELEAAAPRHFVDTIQKRARGDALRELSHRETLDRLHGALVKTGKSAILLKGAALYLLERQNGRQPARVPGDIDIWLEAPGDAQAFQLHLLSNGFQGDPRARPAAHHLAPVTSRHSAVEIHTAPMPSFWGIPADMARRTVPVPGYPSFRVLSAADMIVHEAVHCTSHLWSFGMKLALDLHRISRLPAPVDWDAVQRTVAQSRYPLAFWAPMLTLADALPAEALPVSDVFIAPAAHDAKAQQAKRMAAARMFTATDDADALNPVLRNLLFMKLMSWPMRASYMAYLFSREAAEARRSAMSSSGGQSWRRLPHHMRQAWQQWRDLR